MNLFDGEAPRPTENSQSSNFEIQHQFNTSPGAGNGNSLPCHEVQPQFYIQQPFYFPDQVVMPNPNAQQSDVVNHYHAGYPVMPSPNIQQSNVSNYYHAEYPVMSNPNSQQPNIVTHSHTGYPVMANPNIPQPDVVNHSYAGYPVMANPNIPQPDVVNHSYTGYPVMANPNIPQPDVVNHSYTGYPVMPNLNSQQSPTVISFLSPENNCFSWDTPNPRAHNSPVFQALHKISDSQTQGLRAELRARAFRIARDNLGSSAPRRTTQSRKHRAHERRLSRQHSTTPRIRQAPVNQIDSMPMGQGFGGPRGPDNAPHDMGMTPAQTNSLTMPISAHNIPAKNPQGSSYTQGIKFETPITPNNFKHPRRLSSPPAANISKKQRASLGNSPTWPQESASLY